MTRNLYCANRAEKEEADTERTAVITAVCWGHRPSHTAGAGLSCVPHFHRRKRRLTPGRPLPQPTASRECYSANISYLLGFQTAIDCTHLISSRLCHCESGCVIYLTDSNYIGEYCPFSCDKRAQLFKHYRLKHGSCARTEPFPCLYQKCLCTYKSLNALNVHLSRFHTKCPGQQQSVGLPAKFCCLSCGFAETCSETEYFSHLHTAHLKVNHKVRCPFKGCNFESGVYSTFKAHKSKVHKGQNWKGFKSEIIGQDYINPDSEDLAEDHVTH